MPYFLEKFVLKLVEICGLCSPSSENRQGCMKERGTQFFDGGGTKAGEHTIECWIPVLEYSKVELPPANKDKY